MESLTSSFSKPRFDGLVPSSSSSSSPKLFPAINFSNRLEFCSSNDKVGNFRFLHVVQNKGISPVHAAPYQPQVDLEIKDDQAEQTEESQETKFVRIQFQLQKNCMFGEQFLIVGDHPIIGSWDPSNALPMTWSEGHQWFVEMDVPTEKTIQYKFILQSVSGDIIWQPGCDRIIKAWETDKLITVCEDWYNAELQKIVEEHQLDHSNETSTLSVNSDHLGKETVHDETDAVDSEDSKTQLKNKPLAQPDAQPMPMVAENIDSPKSTPRRRGVNNMALQSEVQVHDLKQMWKVSQVNDQGKEVKKGNRFEFEGSPVLVPGLTPTGMEETTTNDKVEERAAMENPAEETKNKEMQEVLFNEEIEESDDEIHVNMEEKEKSDDGIHVTMEEKEESDDGIHVTMEEKEESEDEKPQEIVAEVHSSDELDLVDNDDFQERYHSTRAIVKASDVHLAHENVLESDFQWGRGILQKILSKFGFLREILQ